MTGTNGSRFVEIATAGQGPTRHDARVHIFGRRENDTLVIGNDDEDRVLRWKDIKPPRSDGVPIQQITAATMTEWSCVVLYVLYQDGALARMRYSTLDGERDWTFLVNEPAVMSV